MCGRYVLINGERIFTTFTVINTYLLYGEDPFRHLPRYNAAPMQMMPVVAMRDGKLIVQEMQWWLVPSWSKDGKAMVIEKNGTRQPVRTFNAKSETIETSRLFSPLFRGSRCLIPADAFYEWKQVIVTREVKGKKKGAVEKQAYCIRMKSGRPLMFAGVFSVWKNEKGEEFPTFAVITTEPNELMADIHRRMPVILPERHFEKWLDREFHDAAELKKMIGPYPAEEMEAFRVSEYVNNSSHEGDRCMHPLPDGGD